MTKKTPEPINSNHSVSTTWLLCLSAVGCLLCFIFQHILYTQILKDLTVLTPTNQLTITILPYESKEIYIPVSLLLPNTDY